jgi:crotonobetainyl-CoA:carnitine CoA-transferase CaiB-like acyl-CoA transferase
MALLDGLKILTLEIGAAAPFASRLLADMGASVIKIEPPEGDISRGWDRVCNGLSAGFVWLNRNKQSLVLDLKTEPARSAFLDLARDADVVLENYRPGVADKLGVGYGAVAAVNPRIIYGHISGYGPTGPFALEKAFDMIIQGEAGYILMNGSPEAPAKIPLSICDLTAGLYAALGILGLIERRHQTGLGGEVDISMLEAAVSLLGYFPHYYWHRGELPVRTGARYHLLTPYGSYTASDGKVFQLAVLSDPAWKKFCREVIEAPELLTDSRFRDNETRIRNREALEGRLAEIFSARSQAEWLERLRGAGMPCGRVNDLADVLAHPQLAHAKTIQELQSPVGPLKEFANPIRVRDAQMVFDFVPGLGQHTAEIMASLGRDASGVAFDAKR